MIYELNLIGENYYYEFPKGSVFGSGFSYWLLPFSASTIQAI